VPSDYNGVLITIQLKAVLSQTLMTMQSSYNSVIKAVTGCGNVVDCGRLSLPSWLLGTLQMIIKAFLW